MKDKKRNQHYVWQYYLRSWTENGKIICYRDSKLFPTGTDNVVQERDFYKLSLVDNNTLNLIRVLLTTGAKDEIKIAINSTLDMYLEIYKQVSFANSIKGFVENGDEKLDVILNNYVEDIHADMESASITYLENIKNKNLSFLENFEDKLGFNHFLFLQYLRTKRLRLNFIKAMSHEKIKDKIGQLTESWPILHLLYATMFSAAISTDEYQYTLLIIDDSSEFITGDQPIVNTKCDYSNPLEQVVGLELYYPIGPKIGLIVSKEISKNIKMIRSDEVSYYNDIIKMASTEFLIGRNEEVIKKVLSG